jgi:hypothetical protein
MVSPLPFEAVQDTATERSPAVPETADGDVGSPAGMTAAELKEVSEFPAAFVAVTVKV